jgi:hypothetical protein
LDEVGARVKTLRIEGATKGALVGDNDGLASRGASKSNGSDSVTARNGSTKAVA